MIKAVAQHYTGLPLGKIWFSILLVPSYYVFLFSGHNEVCTLLISKGANILAETTAKSTALHCAVEANRTETVRLLMQSVAGDDAKKTALTMAKNSDDKTAWDLAFGAKNKAICQVLKDMGDANGASSSCVIS